MSITVNVPDLGTKMADFLGTFKSFSVTYQNDGAGGKAAMATLVESIRDSNGNHYKDASYSAELPPAAASALANFLLNNMHGPLKTQEGL